MSKISDRLGDRLEPGSSSDAELSEDNTLEEDTATTVEDTVSYPVHYSEGTAGDYTTLNFSDPVGEKTLIPDYSANRVSQSETTETWHIGAEEGTIEVEVESGIESKDKLAKTLKIAYEKAVE